MCFPPRLCTTFLTSYPLDFEDALIVAHMERQGIAKLISYDRGLDQVAGIRRLEPE